MQIHVLDHMNADKEDMIRTLPRYLDFHVTQPKDNIIIPHKIPGRSWESFGAAIFTINNGHYILL